MTAVFLLRVDSMNSKPEGEVYYATKGIIHCNVWASPKLTDHQVIIAVGNKNISKVFKDYPTHNITPANERK